MSSGYINFIGSYDLFGKAVPGATLLIGVLLLLPDSYYNDINLSDAGSSVTLLNVAALLILFLLVGLMIGQGVHTLADRIENLHRVFGRFAVGIIQRIKTALINYTPEKIKRRNSVQAFIKKADSWFNKRYWGMYDILVNHRLLLGKYLECNYDGGEYADVRWDQHEKEELYDRFVAAYMMLYDQDIRKKNPEEIAQQYPLITSRLSCYGETEYRLFQSIYSFCRSMWVVFLLLTFALFISPMFYEPVAISHFPSTVVDIPFLAFGMTISLLLVVSAVATVVFFMASGTYKKHYIEYLIAEFANRVEAEEGTLDVNGRLSGLEYYQDGPRQTL